MSNPLISIIIPTYNRPSLLPRAVQSALEQTVEDLEVIVIDDASPQPVNLPEHPRLRIIRLPVNSGSSAARNAGALAARGRWIAFLDDDDQLLPHMAAVSLDAIDRTTLPKPVAVLSGLEFVNVNGKITQTHLPPTLPRGSHFFLEEISPRQSFLCKQTMVVEREVFLGFGGYDKAFRCREHTEMFLRLNSVCSILGLPIVTYRYFVHKGPRLSLNPSLREGDFNRLVRKHESLFLAHPKMFANFVYKHARISYQLGQRRTAFFSVLWAMRLDPLYTSARVAELFRKRLYR